MSASRGALGAILLVAVLARAGRADAPAGRYVFATAGEVADTQTGLVWQRATAPAASAWTPAGTYCQSLALEGTGWRLPSLKELHTLVDVSRESPAVDVTAFADSISAQYWTSSPLAGAAGQAWVVDLRNGAARTVGIDTPSWIRCVR